MALTGGTDDSEELCAIPDQNNFISGRGGDDTLLAWNGGITTQANELYGDEGNDRFVFLQNSWGRVFGGDDIDTLVLPMARAEAIVGVQFESTLLVEISSLVGDLSVRSGFVEFFEFTDGTVAFADFLSNPVAGDDTGSIDADNVFAVDASVLLANDTDPGNTALFLDAVDGSGSLGTVSLDGSLVTYDPGAAFDSLGAGESATDTFTYTLTKLGFNEDTATVTITVFGVNDDPTATDDVAAGDEDTPVVLFASDLLANDSDPDTGDTLTVIAVDDSGTTGTVVLDGTTITYDPNGQFEDLDAGETGSDTFTYTVSDGNGGTDTATVTLTIAGADDLPDTPMPVDDTATTSEDDTLTISAAELLANDIGAMTVTAVDGSGAAGTVALSGTTITYDPDGQFEGLGDGETATDSFTYTVSGSGAATATATVTVTIDGVNDAPFAVVDSANAMPGQSVLIDVLANDTDPEGDTLTIESGSLGAPAQGSVAVEGNQIRYTANAGASGSDSFSYTVSDGMGGTDTANVIITLDATDLPVPAGRDAFVGADSGVPGNGPVTFDIGLFYGFDFGNFSVASGYSLDVEDPDNADVSIDGDTLTITPDPGYSGLIGLRYSFGDGAGSTEFGRLAVLGWDTSQPVASPLQARFASDSATPSTATGTGGDMLSFGGLTFDGAEEQARLDREGVAPPDFAINGMSIAELANADLSAVVGAAVNDEGFLTFDLEIGGEMVFAIDLDQDVDRIDAVPDETSSFLYRVRDPQGNASIGVFSIEVGTDATPNAAPVAATDRATTAAGTRVLIDALANDTDADGGTLALSTTLPTGPANGTATVEGGRIAYMPDAGFTGTDSLIYAIEDGQGGLAVASVEIEVGADPDAPVAAPDSIATDQFVPATIDVLANDSDPNGDPLEVTEVTRPGRGGVQINDDGTLSYAPRRGVTGEDSFDYTVSDGQGGSATATVTIAITDLPEDIVTARVVAYLYEAAFGRFPDLAGVNFWINTVLTNPAFTQKNAASAFLQAPEFESLFGSVNTLTDTQLIEQLYLNVLDRAGEAGGVTFWEGQLARPSVTREDMLLSFAESAENQFGSPRISTLEEVSPGQWDFI